MRFSLLGLSALLVALLELVGLPAALLLGPMVGAITVAARGGAMRIPAPLFQIAQGIVALLIAKSLTRELFTRIAADWPLFFGSVFAVLIMCMGLGVLIARRGVLPGTTAIWGSCPGAATAMVVMSEAYGADVRLVAFMQYIRVVLVAAVASLIAHSVTPASGPAPPVAAPDWLAAPLWSPAAISLAIAVAGSLIGQRLRLPAGALLFPMLIGAALQNMAGLHIELHPLELAASYTIIGWAIGLRFTPDILRAAAKALPPLLLSTAAMILMCGMVAALLVVTLGIDPLTAYFATSPGGTDTVAIIAASSRVDVAFVMAMQCARFLIVMFAGPLIARIAAGRMLAR